MEDILIKIGVSVAVAAITGLGGWLIAQIRRYKKLSKQEEDKILKASIAETFNEQLDPIRKDILDLQSIDTAFTTRLNPIQEEIDHLKDDITEILDNLKAQGLNLQTLTEREELLEQETCCAWRYRIRTLCHCYLQRGSMTHKEFTQLQEMFAIYTALGGNGQTKELYDRTMKLDIKNEE